MNRNSNAILSAQELASLRRVGSDPRQPTPGIHRQLLISMQLVSLAAGILTVTDEGRRRLSEDRQRAGDEQHRAFSGSYAVPKHLILARTGLGGPRHG